MKEKTVFIGIILISIMLASVQAHGDFNETKQLIDSGVSCKELSEEQLEEIGEYYMEQMHPGEAHEIMDEMMGGEGSESLKLMHINMAKGIYCDENSGMMGMMNMMMGEGGMMNMMGGNMMNSYYNKTDNKIWFFSGLIQLLIITLLVLLIIWLIKKIQEK